MRKQKSKEKNTLYAPVFPDKWNKTVLSSLADWINGMAFKDFNFTPKGKPVIKIAEIKNGITIQTKFTNGNYDKKYYLQNGDMLFCWSGQPETSIDVFLWKGPQGWLNQHSFKVIPKIEAKEFFFYLLKYLKPNFIQIAINKQTTGLGHITKGDLEKFIVRMPNFPEQKAIAAVLSSFDDKIELLREENKTLESIAQTIFEEWFVKFNFPDENGKPYKDGGGKMINSEFGEIPEGWKVEKLTKIFDFIKGIEPGSVNYCSQKLSENYLPFYRVQNITIYGNLTNLFVKKDILKEKTFNVDDILISMDGTIGRVFIGGTGGYSSGIRKVICKKDYC